MAAFLLLMLAVVGGWSGRPELENPTAGQITLHNLHVPRTTRYVVIV